MRVGHMVTVADEAVLDCGLADGVVVVFPIDAALVDTFCAIFGEMHVLRQYLSTLRIAVGCSIVPSCYDINTIAGVRSSDINAITGPALQFQGIN